MRLPADLLLRAPEEAARLLALSYLDEAAGAAKRLSQPTDSEALHDFRVGLRRLRSCCRAYSAYLKGSVSGKTRRRLRRLTNSTNSARDAEVQLAWLKEQADRLDARGREELEALITRLERRLVEAYQEITAKTTERFGGIADTLRNDLSEFRSRIRAAGVRRTNTFGQVTGQLLVEQVEGLGAALTTIGKAVDITEAHSARIAAKRLRYLLEPLQRRGRTVKSLVERLKNLQDTLGDLHDMQVLEEAVTAAVVDLAAQGARQLYAMAIEGTGDPGSEVAVRIDEERTGLAEVGRLVRARSEELFATLETDWLGDQAQPFLQRVERLGKRLVKQASSQVEIERKYLLDGLPDAVRRAIAIDIEQGWVPGRELEERVRMTRENGRERYWRTIKFGGGVARTEVEEETDARVFGAFWPLTQGRRITKRRYVMPDGDLTWELDEFTDRALVLAEVELPFEDAAVKLPDWLEPHVLREVTGDPTYLNINLAR